MKKIHSAVLAAAGACAVAVGGSFAGAGAASAAGDLWVTYPNRACVNDNTIHMVNVHNWGTSPVNKVRIGFVGGPEFGVPDVTVSGGAVTVAPGISVSALVHPVTDGKIVPGGGVMVNSVQPGCGPWALAAYAIGDPVDNLLNKPNADFGFGLSS